MADLRLCQKLAEHMPGMREYHVQGTFTEKPHCPHCGMELHTLRVIRREEVTYRIDRAGKYWVGECHRESTMPYDRFSCPYCYWAFDFTPNQAIAFLKGEPSPMSVPSLEAERIRREEARKEAYCG